jgi:hypothetical protein
LRSRRFVTNTSSTFFVIHGSPTGCAEPLLLRASRIKPRAQCETDAERLDVYNGLLLAAHLDAAFDAGLIDFDDSGRIRFAERFSPPDRLAAGLDVSMSLAKLTPEHRVFIAWRPRHPAQSMASPDDGTRVQAPAAVRQRISPSQEKIRTLCRAVWSLSA